MRYLLCCASLLIILPFFSFAMEEKKEALPTKNLEMAEVGVMSANIDLMLKGHANLKELEQPTPDEQKSMAAKAQEFKKEASKVAGVMWRQNGKKCCLMSIIVPCLCPCFSSAALYCYLRSKFCP